MSRLSALAVVLTLLCAGCGLFRSDADRIVEAGVQTTGAGSARVAVTTVVDGGTGQAKQRTDANGCISFPDNLTELELRVGVPQLAGGSTSEGGVPMVVIGDGTSLFLRSPAWPQSQAWTRVPLDAGAGAAPGAVNDLGAQLQLLGAGVSELEELGTDDVRGEATDHVRVDVDLDRALAAAPEEDREALRQLADRTEGTFPLELWIGDGRVRRMSYAVDVPPATVSTVIEYWDFGVGCDRAIPDNVVDLEQAAAAGTEQGAPELAAPEQGAPELAAPELPGPEVPTAPATATP
jgi:hypothetical protein